MLGATSVIGRATAQAFADAGYDLVLAGRAADELRRVAADLRVRSEADVRTEAFDALDTATHAAVIRHAIDDSEDRLVGAVVAFGELGDAERAAQDFEHAEEIIRVNYIGAVSALTLLADYFEKKRAGFIVAISSVAGDRGRRSNYVYGSSKGALSLYLQGLRGRLHASGVQVLTVKPGFIDTRMTFGNVSPHLAADPDKVGAAILKAVGAKRSVVYVPGYWSLIMKAINLIPERLFKRLDL